MFANRFVFLDLCGKLLGLCVLLIPEFKQSYLLASIVYFAILVLNHFMHGSETKEIYKIFPTLLIGHILNFIILVFFMAPIFMNFWGVVKLALVLSIHGFVNIAMISNSATELLGRYFPLKVKVLQSINEENTRLFEFLTCWFTYFGCYLATQFYLD
jgi:hypothetical protein